MCMVLQGYDNGSGVGGHIATYASTATMYEIGFNHFFRKKSPDYGGDLVSFQPHASPGIYARAFLEGRLSEEKLKNFRRELQPEGGLPSYPHPRRLPWFWEMPCASMGLSPVSAIYQARFSKYLINRGLKADNGGKVWSFIGDGEMDEPEIIGTINIAAREKLDNVIFVVNCNLQRLDGPVRGNGKVIQEFECLFFTKISISLPDTSAGTSKVTLSVSTSINVCPFSIVSPNFTKTLMTTPSLTSSPNDGIKTSIIKFKHLQG